MILISRYNENIKIVEIIIFLMIKLMLMVRNIIIILLIIYCYKYNMTIFKNRYLGSQNGNCKSWDNRFRKVILVFLGNSLKNSLNPSPSILFSFLFFRFFFLSPRPTTLHFSFPRILQGYVGRGQNYKLSSRVLSRVSNRSIPSLCTVSSKTGARARTLSQLASIYLL